MKQKHMLGGAIEHFRNAKGMTQKDLGKCIEISDKAVSKWENYEANPKSEYIPCLVEALDVTADQLFSKTFDKTLDITNISRQETNEYSSEEIDANQSARKRVALLRGLAVLFVISASSMLFLREVNQVAIGLLTCFVMLIIGFSLMITAEVYFHKYDYIKGKVVMREEKRTELIRKYHKFLWWFIASLILGISMVLMSIVPVLIMGNTVAFITMFNMIALGIFFIINALIRLTAYTRILDYEARTKRIKI